MRYLLIILLVFCFQSAISQLYQSMPQYGYGPVKRMDFDSSLTIPTTCGVPSLRTYITKKAAIAYDSCNKRLYYYDPKLMAWDTIKGGGGSSVDTTSLSNRINNKVDSIKRSNDSVYYYKNGIKFFSFRDSSQNGRWGNDTALVILAKVHNDAGSTLLKGEIVYLSGANGDVASVKRANNKYDSTSATTIGMVKDNISVNDTGWVVTQGQISKINTSAFAPGDIVYLDSIDGKFTKTKQYAPYHLLFVGVVERANAGNGQLYIKPSNGFEISELHDVAINGKVNNQVLVYSDTLDLWKNRNIYSVIDTTSTIQTKFRSDSARSNTYSAIANKLNISDTSAFLRDGDSSLYQTKFRSDTARTNTYTAIAGREAALTFSTGLTRSTNTITSNLSTGVSGGQSVIGGTASGNALTLSSTSNATKGKILFGTSAYDEANNRMGIGTASPVNPFDVIRGTAGTMARNSFESAAFSFNGDMKVGVYTSSATSTDGAALTFAQTNLQANSRYPGFDMQYVYSSTVANNAWRLNYTERSAAGAVQNYAANLFATYADGRVVINPATLNVTASAKLFVGHNTDAGYMLDVNGTARATQFILRALNNAPASATATGTTGEIRIVNGFIYVCVATNTWQRAALSTW